MCRLPVGGEWDTAQWYWRDHPMGQELMVPEGCGEGGLRGKGETMLCNQKEKKCVSMNEGGP